jgi:hypothetical protein
MMPYSILNEQIKGKSQLKIFLKKPELIELISQIYDLNYETETTQ